MFYIKDNEQIVLADKVKQNIINSLEFMPQYKDLPILETLNNEVIVDFKLITLTEYEKANAEVERVRLTEKVNYPLKAKVAYTGVRFDYKGEELVFETNETSIPMINFTLATAQQAGLKEIPNWKCRKTTAPYEPVSVTFLVEDFQRIIAFASQMILQAFQVEDTINKEIQSMTVAQLNDNGFLKQAEARMKEVYAKVPVKIEGLTFNV